MNQFAIITLVPDIIDSYVQNSILKKIIERRMVQLKVVNLRDYGLGKHKQIDDSAQAEQKKRTSTVTPRVSDSSLHNYSPKVKKNPLMIRYSSSTT